MKMEERIQTFLAEAGEAACYALCIIKLAERVTGKYFPVVETLQQCIDDGFIFYNRNNPNDNDNFFVSKPGEMLTKLTGMAWTVSKETGDYRARIGEWVVERWERVRVGSTTGHFRLPDWDSLYNSQTVKYGTRISTRVFRRI